MRLFVAVNLPEDERERLFHDAAPLRTAGVPVRWVEPSQIHLTLKFLGDVPEAAVDRVVACVARVAESHEGFSIRARGVGAFPSLGNPRVIFAGIEAAETLYELQASLETELEPLGFPREGRPYHPHVTLGRSRPGAKRGDFRGLDARAARVMLDTRVEVRTVDVMRSTLMSRGARYDRITALPLGVAAVDNGGAAAS